MIDKARMFFLQKQTLELEKINTKDRKRDSCYTFKNYPT